MPPENESGTLITSAQGQLYHEERQSAKNPIAQRAKAEYRVVASALTRERDSGNTGVITSEARDEILGMASFGGILDQLKYATTVDSPKGFVVFIMSKPVRFTQPETTSLPASMARGTLSPVNAAVSS